MCSRSWLTLALSFGINIISVVFNFIVIVWCPYESCGYIDGLGNDSSAGLSIQPDSPNQYGDLQKFVFTSASFSGTVSYVVMIYVLIKTYHYPLKSKVFRRKYQRLLPAPDAPDVVLNPFRDDEKIESTAFRKKQSLFFYFIFFFNVLIFISSIIVFSFVYSQEYNSEDSFVHLFLNIGGLASQFYSWGCAILSCFIFSKVAYSIQNCCTGKVFEHFNEIGEREELDEDFITEMLENKLKIDHENQDALVGQHLEMLKTVDRWYGKTLKCSLHPYSTWFALHWLLYTLTGFISLSYAIEYVLMELYYTPNLPCHGERNSHCRLVLDYILLFSFHHCILFLYPCFRAASVTAARFILIKKVSNANWPHISLADKQAFLQYLKDENNTFKVHILCAKLSFGFELTYLSIFLGIMSLVLKITL